MCGEPRQPAWPKRDEDGGQPKGGTNPLSNTFSPKVPVWLEEAPVALTRLLWQQSSAICLKKALTLFEWSQRMPQIPHVSIRAAFSQELPNFGKEEPVPHCQALRSADLLLLPVQ